eukprot:TRINITY_DN2648_c1_g4_i3.p1 TRINITY_DN2648_c1_g4~~TRINITY_DN2648_c1_g4_i3.p1  ORF type:complete len:1469 (+),score=451.25 TRINITY_DN2648_c1_g4_i3:68-4408(+)
MGPASPELGPRTRSQSPMLRQQSRPRLTRRGSTVPHPPGRRKSKGSDAKSLTKRTSVRPSSKPDSSDSGSVGSNGEDDADEVDGAKTEEDLMDLCSVRLRHRVSRCHRPRALLIVSSQLQRTVARLLLSRGGFHVFEATDGADGLSRHFSSKAGHELVVIDAHLSGINCLELVRIIRDREKQGMLTRRPLVALLGARQEVIEGQEEELTPHEAIRGGFDLFCRRPLDRGTVGTLAGMFLSASARVSELAHLAAPNYNRICAVLAEVTDRGLHQDVSESTQFFKGMLEATIETHPVYIRVRRELNEVKKRAEELEDLAEERGRLAAEREMQLTRLEQDMQSQTQSLIARVDLERRRSMRPDTKDGEIEAFNQMVLTRDDAHQEELASVRRRGQFQLTAARIRIKGLEHAMTAKEKQLTEVRRQRDVLRERVSELEAQFSKQKEQEQWARLGASSQRHDSGSSDSDQAAAELRKYDDARRRSHARAAFDLQRQAVRQLTRAGQYVSNVKRRCIALYATTRSAEELSARLERLQMAREDDPATRMNTESSVPRSITVPLVFNTRPQQDWSTALSATGLPGTTAMTGDSWQAKDFVGVLMAAAGRQLSAAVAVLLLPPSLRRHVAQGLTGAGPATVVPSPREQRRVALRNRMKDISQKIEEKRTVVRALESTASRVDPTDKLAKMAAQRAVESFQAEQEELEKNYSALASGAAVSSGVRNRRKSAVMAQQAMYSSARDAARSAMAAGTFAGRLNHVLKRAEIKVISDGGGGGAASVALGTLRDCMNDTEVLLTGLNMEMEHAAESLPRWEAVVSGDVILTPEEMTMAIPPVARAQRALVQFRTKLHRVLLEMVSRVSGNLIECMQRRFAPAQGAAALTSPQKRMTRRNLKSFRTAQQHQALTHAARLDSGSPGAMSASAQSLLSRASPTASGTAAGQAFSSPSPSHASGFFTTSAIASPTSQERAAARQFKEKRNQLRSATHYRSWSYPGALPWWRQHASRQAPAGQTSKDGGLSPRGRRNDVPAARPQSPTSLAVPAVGDGSGLQPPSADAEQPAELQVSTPQQQPQQPPQQPPQPQPPPQQSSQDQQRPQTVSTGHPEASDVGGEGTALTAPLPPASRPISPAGQPREGARKRRGPHPDPSQWKVKRPTSSPSRAADAGSLTDVNLEQLASEAVSAEINESVGSSSSQTDDDEPDVPQPEPSKRRRRRRWRDVDAPVNTDSRRVRDLLFRLHKALMEMLPHCQLRSAITNMKLSDVSRTKKGRRKGVLAARSAEDYDFEVILGADLEYVNHFNRYYTLEDVTMRQRTHERLQKAALRAVRANRATQTEGGLLDSDSLLLSPFADLAALRALRSEKEREYTLPSLHARMSLAPTGGGGQRTAAVTTFGSVIPPTPPLDTTRSEAAARESKLVQERLRLRDERARLLASAPAAYAGQPFRPFIPRIKTGS